MSSIKSPLVIAVTSAAMAALTGCGSPAAVTTPIDSPSPTPSAPPFADVVQYLNAHAPAQLDFRLDPELDEVAGATGWVAAMCKAVDGTAPPEAVHLTVAKGIAKTATPAQAEALWKAGVEGCYVTAHASRPTGPWKFNANEYANTKIMTALHKAGFDEFIRALSVPDEYVDDLCSGVDEAAPEDARAARSQSINALASSDYLSAFGKAKVEGAVDHTIAACFDTGASKAYVPPPTPSQENATRSGQQYIEMSGFSRTGLIKQLEYEGYSPADAAYAADHVSVDWTAEADEAAKQYTDMTGFSRTGLIKQLQYEGFTYEQASHGASSVGL